MVEDSGNCRWGIILLERYVLTDYSLYNETFSYISTTTTEEVLNSFKIDNEDIEITGKISGSNRGFYLELASENNPQDSNRIEVGVDGGNYLAVFSTTNGTTTNHTRWAYRQYTNNNELSFSLQKIGTNVTVSLDNLNYTFTFAPDLMYFILKSINNSKTVTYKDITIKKL